MRRVVVVGGSIVAVCLLVALLALRIVGLDPRERRPGLWLTGEVVTAPVTDWSFTDRYPTISKTVSATVGIARFNERGLEVHGMRHQPFIPLRIDWILHVRILVEIPGKGSQYAAGSDLRGISAPPLETESASEGRREVPL